MPKKVILIPILSLFLALPVFAESKMITTTKTPKVKQKVENKTEISTKEAKEALTKKTHIFIDVREQSEYDEAHIEGVKLIPLGGLDQELSKLDKKVKYITVCRSGKRSLKAAKMMKEKGFNVVSMAGGMNEWQEKGFSIKK